MLSEQDLTKYNTCSSICKKILNEIVEKINTHELLNTKDLCKYGDLRIVEECSKIYKKEKNKGISFATCISLNNCVGYYIHEEKNDLYNVIKGGDIVKIELGVQISGCISILGETIIGGVAPLRRPENDKNNDNKSENNYQKYIDFLDSLKHAVVENMKIGASNDDIKMLIESKCTENECFPVENTTSYQHLDNQLNTIDSKCIITNYQKYFDENDNVITPNYFFEFEKHDTFTINLTIVPDLDLDIGSFIEKHEPHIYRFNDSFYNLKMKMSREFCSIAQKEHLTNAFNCIEYKKNPRNRVGIKECVENCILEEYPIIYNKNNLPVFHKKFTVIVKNHF